MKRIILIGANGSLGSEVVKICLKKNIEVIGISRKKPNFDIIHIKTDLNSDEEINNAIKLIKSNYFKFDAIINCAGIFNISKLEEINEKDIYNLYNINLFSIIKFISKLTFLIKTNGTDILIVGSSASYKTPENQLIYSSSKWAIKGLNENLRKEFQGTKTRVISFNPGGFKSNLLEKATGKKGDFAINLMDPKELAILIVQFLELPKNIEISEILINRK